MSEVVTYYLSVLSHSWGGQKIGRKKWLTSAVVSKSPFDRFVVFALYFFKIEWTRSYALLNQFIWNKHEMDREFCVDQVRAISFPWTLFDYSVICHFPEKPMWFLHLLCPINVNFAEKNINMACTSSHVVVKKADDDFEVCSKVGRKKLQTHFLFFLNA